MGDEVYHCVKGAWSLEWFMPGRGLPHPIPLLHLKALHGATQIYASECRSIGAAGAQHWVREPMLTARILLGASFVTWDTVAAISAPMFIRWKDWLSLG